MEFSLEPRPIPVLKPLRLEVRVAGFKADSMEVDFAGEDMKMGQTSLPVCVRDKMSWQSTILVESDGKQIAVPFRFETKRN
jgi:hypothetical protein